MKLVQPHFEGITLGTSVNLEACERGIVTHRPKSFHFISDHREHEEIELVDRESKGKRVRVAAQG